MSEDPVAAVMAALAELPREEAERYARFFERLARFCEEFNSKIEAAGFADHPEDYLWRLVSEGVMTFRDLKDGTADLADIMRANDALDRHLARQQAPSEAPIVPTREARARQIAKLMLQDEVVKPGRGGLSQAARQIAPMVRMTQGATRNAIRGLFHT